MKKLFFYVQILAMVFFSMSSFLPQVSAEVPITSFVTNGTDLIGSFPVADSDLPNTTWRIDTETVDSASVTSAELNFVGPSNTTLSDVSGWTTLFNSDEDDDYLEVPFDFDYFFNTVSYDNVFIGSNTYLTFGEGTSTYSDLAVDVPPLPGVHVCAGDHSYQKVFYKLEDANTMRIRYEGTNDTSGENGAPNIVYEAVFYANQSYFDLNIGRNDGCSSEDYDGLDVTKLGHGQSDYSLPSTCPSTACNRGDIYGAQLVFSEELDGDSKTAVENALTAGASTAPRIYVWNGNILRIYATTTTTFANDILLPVVGLDGSIASNLLLIDSAPELPNVVYVDDDYSDEGENDGHTWGYDAFDDIQQGIDAVAEGGTVNVLTGYYSYWSTITIETDGIQIIGPGINNPDQAVVQNVDCNRVFDVRASGVRIEGLVISQRDGDGYYCYSSPVIRVGNSDFGVASTTIYGNEIAGGYIGVAVNYQSADTTIQNNHIHDNDAYGVVIWENVNTIQDNEISYNGWGIGMACGGGGCSDDRNLSGTEVLGNYITNNYNGGIQYYAGDQESPVTIGPDNIITENGEGIYINGGSYNLFINGNQIYNNILPDSGLHVEDNSTGLDATGNWWGDSSGPYEEIANSEGLGEIITIINSAYIYYRPFCIDGDCDNLSSVEVTPDNLGLLFENGGSITPMLDDGVATSTASVTSLIVNEETSIAVPAGSGTSTVVLPAETVITKTDGGTFDAGDITAADVAISGISGLTAGKVVEGAFQWGVPSLGLTFTPAITINVFVGEDLDGQTLTIYRSNSQTSGWETSGIVAPGTCIVDEGICSFQTTKASYFAVARSVAVSSGGGGGSVVVASPCTEVSYDEWGSCVNGMQYRNLLGQVPSGCTLTAEQQSARSKVCSGSGTGIQATVGAIISDIDVMGVMTRERAMVGKVNTALTNRLSGRILLQVEEKGQAWYLEPLTKKKHFMGRPFDAFNLMRKFGLGISNANLKKFQDTGVPRAFAGRILLQVEANGEAYYVNPVDLKLHYLGRPADAFRIMRELSLGISNIDIRQISVGE
jgi:parallel beta-helix repeat protein